MKTLVTSSLLFFTFCIIQPLFSGPTILPIHLEGKFILIEGTVDEQSGFFVLDTGASGLILNSRHFKGKATSDIAVYGVNGDPKSVQSLYVNFALKEEKWKGTSAVLITLDYLEVAKNVEILGLIGGDMFWKYEMIIDFTRMEVQLQRIEKDQASFIEKHTFEVILPIKLKGGMPCVEAILGDNTYLFALDTAAEDNMISQDSWEELKQLLFKERLRKFRGISQNITQVESGYLGHIQIGNFLCIPMSTLFTDLNNINRNFVGQKIDGILGFELLKQYKVAINFKDKVLALTPHRSAVIWQITANTDRLDSTQLNFQRAPILLPSNPDK